MDTNNGRIYTPEEMEKLFGGLKSEKRPKSFIEMILQPTPEQLDRIPPRVEKDEPCPCKSGKNFGECCFEKSHPHCEICGGELVIPSSNAETIKMDCYDVRYWCNYCKRKSRYYLTHEDFIKWEIVSNMCISR